MKLLQWDFDAWEDYLYQSRQSTTSIGVTHRMGVGECLFCNLLVVNVLLYQLQTVFVLMTFTSVPGAVNGSASNKMWI